MELMSVLRQLRRRPLLAVAGLLPALLAAAIAGGVIAVGPFASGGASSAVASSRVQVDTPRPLAADLGASNDTIAVQTALLAESLSDAETRIALARGAAIAPEELSVRSPGIEQTVRSPLARVAEQAASGGAGAYTLRIDLTPQVPIMTLVATAPDRASAMRLVMAAPAVLEGLAERRSRDPRRRISATQLGAARSRTIPAEEANPVIAVFAGIGVLVLWCCAIVVLGGLRRGWRTYAGGDGQGRVHAESSTDASRG